ncbi:MAG: protein kinase domain-containing protein [Planctomycetota bacterium]|jgi:WD40 repeat protein
MADLRRVLAVFRAASRVPEAGRASFLDAECGSDDALRAEVDAMFRAEEAGGFDVTEAGLGLGRNVARAILDDAADDAARKVGKYTIVRRLGEGAMGVVYEAIQDVPRRAVALKLMRPWAVNEETSRRFQQEVEALGRLQHPGIAQVLEGGTVEVEEGLQSFLAMELVEGVDVVAHAKEHGLGRDRRLRLIARIADAVQHAHESGVVHRDLKPDNILVTPEGQPKILDFGVARIIEPGVAGVSITAAGELVGTIAYMSPEQLVGAPDIGPLADIYSLGIIAYELLADDPPVRFEGRPLAEAILLARDSQPMRLGARDVRLRGDPETIVSKAMEREPARRYESAGAMADDIRRFLDHEPIRARPASPIYRARKFARRHRALVGVAASLVLVLAAGLVFAALSWKQDRENAARSRRELYRTAVSAAAYAIERHDWARVRVHLDEAPAGERAWEWRYLAGQIRSWLVEHESDATPIGTPACAPDGSFVATALDNGTVALWHPTTARTLRVLDAGTPLTTLARTLPPGQVVAGTVDGRILVWDLDSGARRVLDAGRDEQVLRLDAARDGLIVCQTHGAKGHKVRVLRAGSAPLEIEDGKTWHLQNPDLVLFPGGQRLAALTMHPETTWGRRSEISLFDVGTARRLKTTTPDSEPSCLALSPDGRWLAVGDRQRNVRILDAETLQEEADLLGHVGAVTDVAFTADGQRLVSSSEDGTLRIWDLARGICVGSRACEGRPERLAVHPDGGLVSTGGGDAPLRTWRLAPQGGKTLAGHRTYVYGVEFSPDGRLLVSTDYSRSKSPTCRLWNPVTGEQVAIIPFAAFGGWMAFSRDGRRLVQGADTWGGVRTIDLFSRNVTVSEGARFESEKELLEDRTTWQGVLREALDGRTGVRASDTAVSRDGAHVAHRTGEDAIEIRRGWRGPVLAGLAGTGLYGSPDFSPDGRLIACSSEDGTVHLWDWQLSPRAERLAGHTSRVFCVRFHPDGQRLASGGNDNRILLWDIRSRERVLELTGHTRYVYGLAWSPDGTLLVSASGDFSVRVWDAVPPAERHAQATAQRAELGRLRPRVKKLWDESNSAEAVATEFPAEKQAAVDQLLLELVWQEAN